jgi:tetratricopeptide (TPR) repeat protein
MRRYALRLLVLIVIVLSPFSVRADIAPPDQPPGANLAPEYENTQVRMVSETVLIEVEERNSENSLGHANVTARFVMHNLGSDIETMFVRFPLTFWNGASDGFWSYPELSDIQFSVGGETVGWQRVTTPNPQNEEYPIPWAAFGVTFPPHQDVLIEVAYTAKPVGEYPFVSYSYILETGAGWKGGIGSADLIVRLPYEANDRNVIIGETTGWSVTSPGVELEDREVSWHFENFEPTWENNIEISLVIPSAWRRVLEEQANVTKNPQDGEAWGRLGKIYKEIASLRRLMREDEGGKELYQLALEAYQNAVNLLPNDALWHAGFADLLWNHAYWDVFQPGSPNLDEIQRAVAEIKIAYELKPEDPKVLDILDNMTYGMPSAIERVEDGYVFSLLTATPTIVPTWTPTSDFDLTPIPSTPTREASATKTIIFEPSPTQIPTHTSTPVPETTEASDQRSTSFCTSALLFLPLAVLLFRKRR